MAKILLVEDDKFISRAYKDGLARVGYEVVTVLDGSEAVDTATKENPDLVLLDLILPGMDGFEILQVLRSKAEFKDKPVIILSNLGQESDISKAKELGATDYLTKSDVSLQVVIDKVKSYLKID